MAHWTQEDYDYAVQVRRDLHENPELGFDLDSTVFFVRQEPDKLGIAWTDRYGKGSVAAWIGPANSEKAVGFRADTPLIGISRRAVARDLDFLRDEERATLARLGYRGHIGLEYSPGANRENELAAVIAALKLGA